jgi:hypothetical protein
MASDIAGRARANVKALQAWRDDGAHGDLRVLATAIMDVGKSLAELADAVQAHRNKDLPEGFAWGPTPATVDTGSGGVVCNTCRRNLANCNCPIGPKPKGDYTVRARGLPECGISQEAIEDMAVSWNQGEGQDAMNESEEATSG